MSVQSKRSCWWCSQKLMTSSSDPSGIAHRKVKTRDGHEVWVHVCCEEAAAASQKVLTANIDEYPQ